MSSPSDDKGPQIALSPTWKQRRPSILKSAGNRRTFGDLDRARASEVLLDSDAPDRTAHVRSHSASEATWTNYKPQWASAILAQ